MKKLLTVFAFLLAFSPIFAQSKPNLDSMTFYKNGQTLDFYNSNNVVVYQAGQGTPVRKGEWSVVKLASTNHVNGSVYSDIKIEIPVGSRIVSMKGIVLHNYNNGKVLKLTIDGEEWTFNNY